MIPGLIWKFEHMPSYNGHFNCTVGGEELDACRCLGSLAFGNGFGAWLYYALDN